MRTAVCAILVGLSLSLSAAAQIRLIPGQTEKVLVLGFDQESLLVKTKDGKRVRVPRDLMKHKNLISGSTQLQIFIPKTQSKMEKI